MNAKSIRNRFVDLLDRVEELEKERRLMYVEYYRSHGFDFDEMEANEEEVRRGNYKTADEFFQALRDEVAALGGTP